jgi:hypothetical protein
VAHNDLVVGAVITRSGTIFPSSAQVNEDSYLPGWSLIRSLGGPELDRKIRDAGWNFFFMAGSVQANAWGRQNQKTVRTAMRRVLAKLQPSAFNCLEITEITARTLFGLPYTHVAAHSRHVQTTCYLGPAAARGQVQADAMWATT